jgi:hypothetical protein
MGQRRLPLLGRWLVARHREPRARPALAAAQCSDLHETFEPQRRGTF